MCISQIIDGKFPNRKGGGAGSGQGVGAMMSTGGTAAPKRSTRMQRTGTVLPMMAAFGAVPKLSGGI